MKLRPAGPAVTAILILVCGGGAVLLSFIGLSEERTCLAGKHMHLTEVYSNLWCNGITAVLTPLQIGLGILFLVTGSIGMATVGSRIEHRKAGLRVGFIVLTIFIVLFYGPLYTLLSWAELKASVDVGTLPTFHLIAGVCVTIVSIIGASSFCCCLPTKEDEPVQALQWTNTGPSPIAMGCVPPQSVDTSRIIDHDQLKGTC